MIKNIIYILMFCNFILDVKSQNLVQNGSFEEHKDCPNGYSPGSFFPSKNELIPYWYSPTQASPDYYNTCGKRTSKIYIENINVIPIDGNAYSGLITGDSLYKIFIDSNSKSYREYIMTEIKESLIKDSIYCFSMYYCLAPNSLFYNQSMEVLFSSKKMKQWNTKVLESDVIASSFKLISQAGWRIASFEYKAKGGEKFLTIGNFKNNGNTFFIPNEKTSVLKDGQKMKNSYYFIDKVSLTPKHREKCSCNEAIKSDSLFFDLSHKNKSIDEEKRIVLNNVNFETGSFKIIAESYKELDTLAAILRKEKDLQIEVSGHTDNIGKQADNYNLSEARAKAVMDYLIAKGVSKDKMMYKGFADTYPLDSNSTQEGRKRNRRVEILIKPQVSKLDGR